MKKLNRKGFTLVELLAVIIILAIVVGISIPAITGVINGAKNNALGVATEAAYGYLKDQYDLNNVDSTLISDTIKGYFPTTEDTKTSTLNTEEAIQEIGFDPENVAAVTLKITKPATTAQSALICVTVTKVVETGEYFNTTYFGAGGAPKEGAKNTAGNDCP